MINKVTLLGNLGADPDIRYTPQGDAVATLSVATTRRWKDKTSGDKKEAVEWHRVIIWGKQAEIANEYLKKGSQAYFEGRLQTRKWTDDNGAEHYSTEIIAEDMKMLGKKNDGYT